MHEDAIGTVSALADNVRRRLYFHVRGATRPVTRDDAAVAAGISRKLAAFHLDKLVDVGLLDVAPVVRMPGPGRSPKLYRPSGADIAVTIPPRHDDLMAAISLAAIRHGGPDPVASAMQAAHERGVDLGRAVRGTLRPGELRVERALQLTMQALNRQGYEPEARTEPGATRILLRNCPFRRLLVHDQDLVCTLNGGLVGGILAGLGAHLLNAVPVPRSVHCCVTVRTQA